MRRHPRSLKRPRDRAATRMPRPGSRHHPRVHARCLLRSVRRGAVLLVGLLAISCAAPETGLDSARSSGAPDVLRVCADPNNLPFSNERGEGFENRLAEMVAAGLGRRVEYTWWAQRRGFVRNTLNAGTCDVVMGVPAGYELTRTTRPYYRSTYVSVVRPDRGLELGSWNDPDLRSLRIGVHVVGDDYANVPPAQALANRGIVRNVRGYSLFGDYTRPDPPADLITAVAADDIDLAFAWGPLAGFFAARQAVPLAIAPVPSDEDSVPFAFAIAMGVRRPDETLRQELDRFIERHHDDIERLLRQYGVPLLPLS